MLTLFCSWLCCSDWSVRRTVGLCAGALFPLTPLPRSSVVATTFVKTTTTRMLINPLTTTRTTTVTMTPLVSERTSTTMTMELAPWVKPQSVLLKRTASTQHRQGVVVIMAMAQRTRVLHQPTRRRTTAIDGGGDGDPTERTLRVA